MQLTVLGLNHRTAPVEIRERFNFSNDRVASILRRLRNYDIFPKPCCFPPATALSCTWLSKSA